MDEYVPGARVTGFERHVLSRFKLKAEFYASSQSLMEVNVSIDWFQRYEQYDLK